MTILAIDSSTEILSVWLLNRSGGGQLGASRDCGLRHGRFLMSMVDSLLTRSGLKLAEIDLIACSAGPGSFTGLRIGMATAKGLAEAIAAHRSPDKPPLVVVPTLEAIAHGVGSEGYVLPVIDGKKGQYYAALFDGTLRVTADLDLPPEQLLPIVAQRTAGSQVVVTGPHAQRFLEAAEHSVPSDNGVANRSSLAPALQLDRNHRSAYARGVAELAEEVFRAGGYALRDRGPTYVRLSDAQKSRRST